MSEGRRPGVVLAASTVAFAACIAAWLMNGVLVTFLVEHRLFTLSRVEVGWLIGLPILAGSVLRLPVGMLTDRYGGRTVFVAVMACAAAGCLLLSVAETFVGFVLGSLGFGLAGTSFAVGVAYTSLWFKLERQGTALGIFGAGNVGTAATSLGGPALLDWVTAGGRDLEAWRLLPRLYAGALLVTAVLFWLVTLPRRPEVSAVRGLRERVSVLGSVRVWRFGLYYFVLFGGFVAVAQWLLPYYVGAYGTSLAQAGLLAAAFSLPCGLMRALGGWLSDRFGARATMYCVLATCIAGFLLLSLPPAEVTTSGEGVSASRGGLVTAVSDTEIAVGETRYALAAAAVDPARGGALLGSAIHHEPVVKVGDRVERRQLLARGVTRLSFRPNLWLFTISVLVLGMAMGVGMAAVYKHIPDYFPGQVGAVGGMVGVLGGLGGFFGPIFFGYLLGATGLWTSCWAFLLALSLAALVWMHSVVRGMERSRTRAMEIELATHARERGRVTPTAVTAAQLVSEGSRFP